MYKEFTCPKCGGHMFGTSINNNIGVCHTEGCDYKWERSYENDAKVFVDVKVPGVIVVNELITHDEVSVSAKCSKCNGTGFYNESGPGIIPEKEFSPCMCGAEDPVYLLLAQETDKATRGWAHLQAIWDALEMGYDWEYGGFLERHAIEKIKELRKAALI